MEEDLSFEFGFNSHENLLRIAERKARFRQSSLTSGKIVLRLSNPTVFRASFLREIIILERVSTLLLGFLHHECGSDGHDLSQIHYVDRIDGFGLGQVIIPSTELLCKVQMAVIESMFRAISYHDFMKASDMKA